MNLRIFFKFKDCKLQFYGKRRLFCYFSVNPCMPASRLRRLLRLKRKKKTLLRLSLASFSPHPTAAVTNFKLRKQYTFKSQDSAKAGNRKRKHHGDKPIKVYKNYHKKFIFPLAGCSACVERFAAHIKKVHGVNPSSNEYKSLLKKAFLKKRDPIQLR